MAEASGQADTGASPAGASCLKTAVAGCLTVAVLGAICLAAVLLAVYWYGVLYTLLGIAALGVVLVLLAIWLREHWEDVFMVVDDLYGFRAAWKQRRRRPPDRPAADAPPPPK